MATYGNKVVSVGGPRKNTTGPTELFTPFEALYKTCFFLDEMYPRRRIKFQKLLSVVAAAEVAADEHYDNNCI